LHAQRKGLIAQADGFYQPVGGVGFDTYAGSQRLRALAMQ
jgi:hypothetical protein